MPELELELDELDDELLELDEPLELEGIVPPLELDVLLELDVELEELDSLDPLELDDELPELDEELLELDDELEPPEELFSSCAPPQALKSNTAEIANALDGRNRQAILFF